MLEKLELGRNSSCNLPIIWYQIRVVWFDRLKTPQFLGFSRLISIFISVINSIFTLLWPFLDGKPEFALNYRQNLGFFWRTFPAGRFALLFEDFQFPAVFVEGKLRLLQLSAGKFDFPSIAAKVIW